LVGAATPENFYSALSTKNVKDGFLNRWIVIPMKGQKRPPENLDKAPAKVPAEIVKAIKALPRAPGIMDRPLGKLRAGEKMKWGAGAKEVYAEFGLRIDALEDSDPQRHALAKRCAENSQRLATNLTLGCGSDVIDVRTMQWATRLVELSLEEMVQGVAEYMGDDYFNFPKFCRKLWIKVRDDGWRSKADLKVDFQNNMKLGFEIDTVLKHLLASNQLKEEPRRIGKRGPETLGYIALEKRAEADDEGETLATLGPIGG
jgi:hypothetical protein